MIEDNKEREELPSDIKKEAGCIGIAGAFFVASIISQISGIKYSFLLIIILYWIIKRIALSFLEKEDESKSYQDKNRKKDLILVGAIFVVIIGILIVVLV